MLNKKKTILIDARHANSTMDGLSRYILELINGLSEIEIPHLIVLHTSSFPFKYLKNPGVLSFHLLNIPGSSPKQHLVVPFIIKKLRADIYYYPFIDPPLLSPAKKNIFAVHDLNHFFFSPYAATERRSAILMAKFFIYTASILYNKIFVFSEFVKKQLNTTVKTSMNKTEVIYHGFSPFPEDLAIEEEKREVINAPYILYVGNNRPHKNLSKLFEAFKILIKKNKEVILVVVGHQIPRFFNIRENIIQSHLENRVMIINKASNSYLKFLYEKALFVIYPSLSEGFGLPLLEAWNFKVPIASSNATCLPEIAGDAAIYFNPSDSGNIAEVMDKLILNKELRNELIENGLKRLKNYTWENSSIKHLKLLLS